MGPRHRAQRDRGKAAVPWLWVQDSAPFGELEAAPGTAPRCGHPAGSHPQAAPTGWKGRATGLPGEGVCVPAVEHSPPTHPGTAEGPEVLGDTQPSSIWPSCASPAQPPLLCRLAWGCGITSCIFASGWALPPMPCPARTSCSPCTRSRAAQGRQDPQHRLGEVGEGMDLSPLQRRRSAMALANLPFSFPKSVQCWYSDALSSL